MFTNYIATILRFGGGHLNKTHLIDLFMYKKKSATMP